MGMFFFFFDWFTLFIPSPHDPPGVKHSSSVNQAGLPAKSYCFSFASLQLHKCFQSCSESSTKWTQMGTFSWSLHQAGVSLNNSTEWGGCSPHSVWQHLSVSGIWGNNYHYKQKPKNLFAINILSFLANILCHPVKMKDYTYTFFLSAFALSLPVCD